MLKNSLNYIKDRFEKCRVADGVYRDEGEVDAENAENDEETKKYALFKIIDLIKDTYKHDLQNQEQAMDKLKNITNNCNSIIEKRFGLPPDYLFSKNVLKQPYYELNNINFETPENTFKDFFEQNGLLNDTYIKDDDDKAIIFKLSSDTTEKKLYIRLSRMHLNNFSTQEPQSSEPVKIFKIDRHSGQNREVFRYLLITNQSFKIEEEGLGGRTTAVAKFHDINKISINKQLQQTGGIGKKTIKNKSKPLKNTILQKKEILGKDMRIYKINGSKKEYVKYKGNLISISDYKKIIKLKKIKNIVIY